MKKKTILAVILIGIICIFGIVIIKLVFFRYPNTLPMGEDPVLLLPLYDFTNNSYIYGYGQVRPDYFHDGIDFGVNAPNVIVAPHNAYVDSVELMYNDGAGNWQTNVRLWLNWQWELELAFESMANNETYGQMQRDSIPFTSGQYIEANQSLGTLLVHEPGATLHISVKSGDTKLCPYTYFSPAAQAAFEAQFWLVNYSSYWCM